MEDNFNDNYLDPSKWVSLVISSGNARERNGRIEFYAPTHYTGGGIKSAKSHDVSNGRVKAKLFSDGYVISCISIVPHDKEFLVEKSVGYTIGIWQSGLHHLFIYRNGKTVFYSIDPLRGNPEDIEIALDGDTIRFYEAGMEVYSESYGTYTKNVNIYLWGVSWYLNKSGTSWADDFSIVKEAPASLSFASIASDRPFYDVGEIVRIAFMAMNEGSVPGRFRVDFYDGDTGALLASFDAPRSVPPGGESDPFVVDVGAMPEKAIWNIRCELTP